MKCEYRTISSDVLDVAVAISSTAVINFISSATAANIFRAECQQLISSKADFADDEKAFDLFSDNFFENESEMNQSLESQRALRYYHLHVRNTDVHHRICLTPKSDLGGMLISRFSHSQEC